MLEGGSPRRLHSKRANDVHTVTFPRITDVSCKQKVKMKKPPMNTRKKPAASTTPTNNVLKKQSATRSNGLARLGAQELPHERKKRHIGKTVPTYDITKETSCGSRLTMYREVSYIVGQAPAQKHPIASMRVVSTMSLSNTSVRRRTMTINCDVITE